MAHPGFIRDAFLGRYGCVDVAAFLSGSIVTHQGQNWMASFGKLCWPMGTDVEKKCLAEKMQNDIGDSNKKTAD